MSEEYLNLTTLMSFLLGISLAACTGFRVFLPMLIGSIAFRMGWIQTSDSFQWLASTPALVIFSVAAVVEILAYLIPWLDHALDVIAGPLAVAAGALLASAVFHDIPTPFRIGLGIIAGGGAAGAIQATTTLLRLGSTKMTGGLGNPIFSKMESALALIGPFIAIFIPIVAILLFIGFFYLAYRLIRRWIKHKSQDSNPPSVLP